MNEVVSISSTQCFSMGLKLPPMLKHTSMEDASGETWPLVSLTPPFSWRNNTTFVYISLVHVDMSDPSQFYMISFHISYIIYFMYIDHRWFSKHVPSVPSTFIMNYVPDPAAPAATAAPAAPGCAWRAGGDLPRAWDGLDHEGHLGRVLLRRQLRLGGGSAWVIDLYDFMWFHM